jgi:hypothetical protein
MSKKETAKTVAELPEVNFSDYGEVRFLHLGTEWVQGSMLRDAPYDIELEYVQRMMAGLLFTDAAAVSKKHAMQLGLGSAALTKFCYKKLRMKTAEAFGPEAVWAFRPTREGNTVVLAQRDPTRPERADLLQQADVIESRWDLPAKKWLRLFAPAA